jgi:hypothetical protein
MNPQADNAKKMKKIVTEAPTPKRTMMSPKMKKDKLHQVASQIVSPKGNNNIDLISAQR